MNEHDYAKTKRNAEKVLVCPDCDGTNMHQRSIAIDRMFQSTDIGPISIGFECEGCDTPPLKILNIYQHKGETYLRWLED